MKQIALTILLLCCCLWTNAQDTLKISQKEAEAVFLQHNFLLIAEKLNIERQKAELIQAKLWPNPQFSISEVNLWATDRQTGGETVSPPFWNNVGRNQQLAFELNQLIQTAGKRRKLVALEQLDVSKSEQYFEELLRTLKLELRHLLADLQYTQASIDLCHHLIDNLSNLLNAFRNQVDQGHIAEAEFIRLNARNLEIQKQLLDLNNQAAEIQKDLQQLLHLDAQHYVWLTEDILSSGSASSSPPPLSKLIEEAGNQRPDLILARLEEEYAAKLLSYENANRFPDLTLGVNYDRNGNTMLDFVGVGVALDLPLFNRNRGNIQKARIQQEHASLAVQQKELNINQEVSYAYILLKEAIRFYESIDLGFDDSLDELLAQYTKNFAARNMSLLEYLDYLDSYRSNKTIILDAKRDIILKAEALNYYVGQDFINP